MAAALYEDLKPSSLYIDRQLNMTKEEYLAALELSKTVYIGNLSYFTKEEQLYELFGLCGHVQQVIMGLDRYRKTPCGFCFVEFETHEEAQLAINCFRGTKVDDHIIRVDWDPGFKEGRQFGRGKSGGQKRDSVRNEEKYDEEDITRRRKRFS
jgi:nuclear cap-binding protein subunit 2